ncbi:MAG: restriction endonuclease subunit S [Candidatus Eisenbacteria bacterium]|nr:restriction endonuclease subunit S [Candidatus Eisenbacteria bacterium]
MKEIMVQDELPKGWVWAGLEEIGEVNPGFYAEATVHDTEVTFLPMKCVEELTGRIDLSISKKLSEVRKGYTHFVNGDLLLAKITPCMENGKVAIAHGLKNGIGFGSTEFHVVRLHECLPRRLFFFFLIREEFRKEAQGNMTGSAGQLRVPASYIQQSPLPLPPLAEQRRIVAKIEELFTRLDAGVEALKKVRTQLKRYRQTVLKSAFEGKLTEEWREAHKGEVEPASMLLERIKQEQKTKLGKKYKELPQADTSTLPKLPRGWQWTAVGELAGGIHYGYTEKAADLPIGPRFLRITDIQNSGVDWDSVPYCKIDESMKEKYLLKDGDLVFARTGATVGKSFLIRGDIPEAVFASYLIRIILHRSVTKETVYYFFQSPLYWLQIQKGKLGIGQPNVNANALSQILLPLPPSAEQCKIVEEIEHRFSVADVVEKAVAQSLIQAERLRQSIMKKAFEGKLVPQDPTDEPAQKLLERIKIEKAKRAVEAKGKKPKRRTGYGERSSGVAKTS